MACVVNIQYVLTIELRYFDNCACALCRTLAELTERPMQNPSEGTWLGSTKSQSQYVHYTLAAKGP